MRLKIIHVLLSVVLVTNLLLVIYLANIQTNIEKDCNKKLHVGDVRQDSSTEHKKKNIEDLVTMVIREYEEFDNDVVETIKSLHRNNLSAFNTVIIGDKNPYPPIVISSLKNVQFISLSPPPDVSFSMWDPRKVISTEYVLFVPDTVIVTYTVVYKMLQDYKKYSSQNHLFKMIAWKTGNITMNCEDMKFDIKRWTLEYERCGEGCHNCAAVAKEHALFMKTNDWLDMSYPFLRPFPESLYIQTSIRKWRIVPVNVNGLRQTNLLFTDSHNKWKEETKHQERLQHSYKILGVKKVLLSSGDVKWYGCNKESSRCFDTVLNDMPEYLYQGRWTAPCCLKALRETAKHVFSILEKADVRYWLEGGSLLGAARSGDIIPWDYDIDIGIYRQDVLKCEQLVQAASEPFLDNDGFVWERATEGEFYRVQYSASNHLHVDIFPFYSKNGIMTKNTWFKTHRQDKEFPEHYLEPMYKINFAGIEVSAPNHVREFLEYKFGKGVIENPQYPDPKAVRIEDL